MSIDHNTEESLIMAMEGMDDRAGALPATALEQGQVEMLESVSLNQSQLNEPKPFACTLCMARFSRIDHLARHVRSHTNKKPFQCEICNKGFSRPSILVRHKLNHGRADMSPKERPTRRARACKACVRCAESKLRCEGADPCERCHRKGIPCRYDESKMKARDLAGRSPAPMPSPSEREINSGRVNGISALRGGEVIAVADSQTSGGSVSCGEEQQPVQIQRGVEELDQQSYMLDFEPSLLFDDLGHSASTISDAWSENDHESSFMEFLNGIAPDPAAGMDFHVVDDEISLGISPPAEDFHAGNPSFKTGYSEGGPKPALAQDTLTGNTIATVLPTPTDAQDGRLRTPFYWRQLSTDEWKSPPTLHASGSFEKLIPPSRWPSKVFSPHPPLHASTRNRLIATILALSDSHEIAHILSCFPSLELLNNLIDNYLAGVASETDSWLHAPTFDPNTELPELVLAVVTAGAMHPNVPELKQLGLTLWDINFSLGSRLFKRDTRTTQLLSHLQALSLQLDVGLWGGDRRLAEMSEALSMSGVTMTRRAGFLRRGPANFESPLHEDSPEVTAAKWHQWAQNEACKRLAIHILIRDAQCSSSLSQPPLLSATEYSVPIPCTRTLWTARTATAWKRTYLGLDPLKLASLPSLTTAIDDPISILSHLPEIDNSLTSLAILSGLASPTFQYAQRSRARTASSPRTTSLLLSSLYQETRDRLESFHATFTDCTPNGLEPETRVFYEHQLMSLHMSIEDVQCLAGKEGVARAQEVSVGLRKWADSKEGRRAVWYAGQVVAALRACEAGRRAMGGNVVAVAVLHAAVVVWAWVTMMAGDENLEKGNWNLAGLESEKRVPSAVLETGLAELSKIEMDSERENDRENDTEQDVYIDGEDGPAVRQFLLLGRGRPLLSSISQRHSHSPSQTRAGNTSSISGHESREGGDMGDEDEISIGWQDESSCGPFRNRNRNGNLNANANSNARLAEMMSSIADLLIAKFAPDAEWDRERSSSANRACARGASIGWRMYSGSGDDGLVGHCVKIIRALG